MTSAARAGLPRMLIVAGHLLVDPAERDAFLAASAHAVALAREAPGGLDYAVTADTLDPRRVDVFERWESEAALLAFRGAGPPGDMAARILDADVRRYVIASVEQA
jgi:heme-degrading monooxygenase HmoA